MKVRNSQPRTLNPKANITGYEDHSRGRDRGDKRGLQKQGDSGLGGCGLLVSCKPGPPLMCSLAQVHFLGKAGGCT